MTITKITVQKKNSEKVSIYVDGKYSFSMTMNGFVKSGLKEGTSVTEEQIRSLCEDDSGRLALLKVFDMISRSLHTEQEIRRKLLQKGFSDDAVAYAVDRAKEYGYVDDESYVRSYIQYRAMPNKWGERKTLMELYKKGISRDMAEQVMSEIYKAEDMEDNARQLAIKKWTSLEGTDNRKRKQKVYSYLLGRGFSYDVINSVIRNIEENDTEA